MIIGNKEGHKSFECPEANGAGRSGGNGCFKCGKEGHKSFDCPDAKGSGGRGQS
ncbi:unnamed protein product, partial [Adineta steineri]